MRYAPRRHRVTGQTVTPTDLERLQDAVASELQSLTGLQFVAQAPATPASPGEQGDVALSGGYLYVCVSSGSWLRVALSTW